MDGKLFPEVTDVGIMTMGDRLSALPGLVHLLSLKLSGAGASLPWPGREEGWGSALCF